nr:unnamed protein product [Spirometra erinaceieuropaei]
MECAILLRLQHPNIVEYKSSFIQDAHLYIETGFCAGGDLDSYLQSRSGQLLDEIEVLDILVQITMALEDKDAELPCLRQRSKNADKSLLAYSTRTSREKNNTSDKTLNSQPRPVSQASQSPLRRAESSGKIRVSVYIRSALQFAGVNAELG